jgi:LCP family protein required for cell wall assembly
MPSDSDTEAGRRRAEPRRRAPGRRRAPRKRPSLLVIAGVTFLVVALTLAGVAYTAFDANIQTFSAAGLSKDRPKDPDPQSLNILLIGSDSREGQNGDLGGHGSSVGRSDTTLLVHIYADHKRAVAVSIPRDTLVTVPSCRLPDGTWTEPQDNVMFNSAYSVGQTAEGNPACTQNTVEELTGLRIDHTVVAGFAGFASLTKAVGGVPVCLPNAVYQGDLDPNRGSAGELLFPAGRQKLAGPKALQYVRLRHGLGDGSDIGRIKRQQAFMASVATKVRREGFTPRNLLPIVNAAMDNVTFDESLGSPKKLLDFAMSLKQIEPRDISFLTIPWQYEGPRVSVVQPDADRLFQALKTDQPLNGQGKKKPRKKQAPEPPKDVSVSVYNGTLVSGLAGKTGDRLEQLGFKVGAVDNADRATYRRSQIRYSPEYEKQARQLAQYVSAKLTPVETEGLSLVLGKTRGWHEAGAPKSVDVPDRVKDTIRTADTNPCSNLT